MSARPLWGPFPHRCPRERAKRAEPCDRRGRWQPPPSHPLSVFDRRPSGNRSRHGPARLM